MTTGAEKLEIEPGRRYAVLNGDMVASTDLAPPVRRSLPDVLRRTVADLPEALRDAIPYPLAIFSGDSWQVLLSQPAKSLRMATLIRAFLRSQSPALDSRLVIGIGTVDFVPGGDIAQAEGEAFRISGRLLAELDERCGMRLRAGDPPIPEESAWDAAVRLLDALIVSAWTPSRARAVWGTLLGHTQSDVAKLWPEPIRQATVSTYLGEARWHTVESVLDRFEEAWSKA